MNFIHKDLEHLAVDIASLVHDPANARLHDARNLGAIKASLAKFGQRAPIVVQRQGMVVRAGNGRLDAARALGWTRIAALVVDEGDVEATAYAIADNRTAELAHWDDSVLAQLLGRLAKEPTLDVLVTGFDTSEIEELAQSAAARAEQAAARTSPGEFRSFDEGIETDHECPRCHYRWSGAQDAGAGGGA